jgi:hypothetical protein
VTFGVVGVALPLTMFNGADQLKTVVSDAGTLGLGLLAAALIAKMFTFGVSLGSGFVGGPIFPSLFIGGTAGVLVHQVIPGVPLGLSFTCLLAATVGALVAAPFAMVLMAAFLTQVGAPADRTHPHRRRHRLPHHGRCEIPPGPPQARPRGRGETSSSGLKVTGPGPVGGSRFASVFSDRWSGGSHRRRTVR